MAATINGEVHEYGREGRTLCGLSTEGLDGSDADLTCGECAFERHDAEIEDGRATAYAERHGLRY